MVDGTLVPLFEKPHHFGEGYFDRKSNYSLNVQVYHWALLYCLECGSQDTISSMQLRTT
jgi:hypothetical protein